MVKLVSLMKRKQGLSREDFANWAVKEHSPLGLKFPGVRGYHISVLAPDQPETEFDGVFELWFDDMDSLQKAHQPSPTAGIGKPNRLGCSLSDVLRAMTRAAGATKVNAQMRSMIVARPR